MGSYLVSNQSVRASSTLKLYIIAKDYGVCKYFVTNIIVHRVERSNTLMRQFKKISVFL